MREKPLGRVQWHAAPSVSSPTVTRDEVHAAVLAFLDQFIERGAAQDVLDLRSSLVRDAQTRNFLEAQLPSQHPTQREAFDAMRDLFEIAVERRGAHEDSHGAPDLVELAGWTCGA